MRANFIAGFNRTLKDFCAVSPELVNFESIQDFGFEIFALNYARIADLTARFRIERGFIQNNINSFAFFCGFDDFCVRNE